MLLCFQPVSPKKLSARVSASQSPLGTTAHTYTRCPPCPAKMKSYFVGVPQPAVVRQPQPVVRQLLWVLVILPLRALVQALVLVCGETETEMITVISSVYGLRKGLVQHALTLHLLNNLN